MKIPPVQEPQITKSSKKVWQKPDFIILDTDHVRAGKTHHQAHEGTGHQSASYFMSVNNLNGFNGTKLQAIS